MTTTNVLLLLLSLFISVVLALKASEKAEMRKTLAEVSDLYTNNDEKKFSCGNGKSIATKYLCDGDDDCDNNVDEQEKYCKVVTPFKCGNDKIIPKLWACDGEDDCGDSTDEKYCNVTCPDYTFKCDNGNCVNRLWACNDNDDCGDGTEKRICHRNTKREKCLGFLFKCEGSSKCVGTQYLCDGSPNCAVRLNIIATFNDKSDEIFCNSSTTCPPSTFQCEKVGCVSFWKLCDGVRDCTDGTDELYCPGSFGGILSALDQVPDDKFDCGNGKLIPARWRCDGLFHCGLVKHDAIDETYCKGDSKPPKQQWTPSFTNTHLLRSSRVSRSGFFGYCFQWMGEIGTVLSYEKTAHLALVSWGNGQKEIVKSSSVILCSHEGASVDALDGTPERVKDFLNQADAKVDGLRVGMAVVPGRHWKWGNQHGGGFGTVDEILVERWSGWIVVRWRNNSQSYVYRYGAQLQFEVEPVLEGMEDSGIGNFEGDEQLTIRANASCSTTFQYSSSYSFDLKDVGIGIPVVPGPNWTYCDNMTSGNFEKGVILSIPSDGMVSVMWAENGPVLDHSFGHDHRYDVALVDDPAKFVAKFKTGEQVRIADNTLKSRCGKKYLNAMGTIASELDGFSLEVTFSDDRTCVFSMGKGGRFDAERVNVTRRPLFFQPSSFGGTFESVYTIIGSIIGGSLIIMIVCCIVVWVRKRSRKNATGKGGRGSTLPIALEQLPFSKDHVIPPSNLQIDNSAPLGTGQFGAVFCGKYDGVSVAVKTVKNLEDTNYLNQFLDEIRIITKIGEHPNIVKFFGAEISKLTQNVILVVLELSPFGDLLTYIRANSSNPCLKDVAQASIQSKSTLPSTPDTSIRQLYSWTEQIAHGMSHLQDRNIVHGDLAARNVLVFLDGVVKLSDFGLSRSLYQYTIYEKKNLCPLPWRWLALESLQAFLFSPKSDVWAYGVTIWEIFTQGLLPFPQHSWTPEFEALLVNGLRLVKPELAPSELYEKVMLPCWNCEPSQRPDFHEILLILEANKEEILPSPTPMRADTNIYYDKPF